MRPLILKSLLAGGCTAGLWAQTATTGPTFHADSRLVEITVVAHDKVGKPVADLKTGDFEVFDNGVRQSIAVFSAFAEGQQRPVPTVAPGVFTNHPPEAATAGRGPTVFLLDLLNADLYSGNRAREQVIAALAAMPRSETAALYVLSNAGLQLVQDFTTDIPALARALRLGIRLPAGAPTATGGASADPHENPVERAAERRQQAMLAPSKIQLTTEALELLARRLGAVHGRKSLIWVSGGFPLTLTPPSRGGSQPISFTDLVDRATDRLNDANVALYAVDARGLIAPAGGSRAALAASDPWPNADAMWRIATRTGGELFYQRNDIDAEVRAAFDDLRVSYTLGYYRSTDAAGKPDHRIKVDVTRKGVDLRYRPGYTEVGPAQPVDDPAVVSLSADVKRRGNALAVTLHIAPPDPLLQEADGRWKGSAELSAEFARADGRPAGKAQSNRISADLTPEARARLLRNGLDYTTSLPIPAQADTLYLWVQDGGSGRSGTVSVPLRLVPESNQ